MTDPIEFEYVYERAIVDRGWDVTAATLKANLAGVFPSKRLKLRLHGEAITVVSAVELTSAEVTLLASAVVTVRNEYDAVPRDREALHGAINSKTEELITAGFEYPADSGKIFSMSDRAQFNLEVADRARDSGLTYPLPFSNIDDSFVFMCPDAAALNAMYLTALGHKVTELGVGSLLKAQANGATTTEEMDALRATNDAR